MGRGHVVAAGDPGGEVVWLSNQRCRADACLAARVVQRRELAGRSIPKPIGEAPHGLARECVVGQRAGLESTIGRIRINARLW